jgi:DNA-binding XRE family transcriptional regulator
VGGNKLSTNQDSRVRIRKMRELAGVSQAQLASVVGLHREHLCMIEKGYRSISHEAAAKIEAYLQAQIGAKASQLNTAYRDLAKMDNSTRLKCAREFYGISQATLAQECGVEPATVELMESGSPIDQADYALAMAMIVYLGELQIAV